jgi:ActR/RegA family two-component response regulator
VREVRQIVPDLRIAISTGYQDEMIEGRALGVHTFLQKPASLGRISQALAELVGDQPSSGA